MKVESDPSSRAAARAELRTVSDALTPAHPPARDPLTIRAVLAAIVVSTSTTRETIVSLDVAAAHLDLDQAENFGAIDADADALLRDCFRDHPAYSVARAHERFLVVGRKGSGKTAIFKRLITEKAPTVLAFGHTFDDYPWPYHDLQTQAGVPEERRYIHSWRYLILPAPTKMSLVAAAAVWCQELVVGASKRLG
jgi:hypothetical protein